MPRVHTTKARINGPKACPYAKAGETYYWWRTRLKGARSGVTRCSLTYPKPSQLTRSDYYQQVYALQEEMAAEGTPETVDEFALLRDEWTQRARDIADQQDEKYENMPDSLRESETGYLLEQRRDECNEWADEMEGVEVAEPDRGDYPQDDDGNDEFGEDTTEAIREAMQELTSFAGPS